MKGTPSALNCDFKCVLLGFEAVVGYLVAGVVLLQTQRIWDSTFCGFQLLIKTDGFTVAQRTGRYCVCDIAGDRQNLLSDYHINNPASKVSFRSYVW